MGFNTIEIALFIKATNTTLITQAKNWLKKHLGSPNFSKQYELIYVTDPDTQDARWIGLAFTSDPGTATQIKSLVQGEPDAKVRMTCRARQKLKEMIKEEMAARDPAWRIKP